MFKSGPLYAIRKELVKYLKKIPIETGDIVYSASNTRGPLGIPFAGLIQKFTHSNYSHATIMYVENEEIYAIDVSDWGTRKLRALDWFDNWYEKDFVVYRLKNKTNETEYKLKRNIEAFLEEDPSYDFNFTDPNSYYCTESVASIYNNIGFDLGGSYLVKDIVPWWFYPLIVSGNFITKITSSASLPLNTKISIVGNEQKGMMASNLTKLIFKFDGKSNMPFYY